MNEKVVICCPLSVRLKSGKPYALNLNRYRNSHYQVLNQAKIAYCAAVSGQIAEMPWMDTVKVKFTVYPANKRIFDISNICSIHEKFLLDCVVKLGKLEDDNWKYVIESTYCLGEVDKDNPMVEAEFTLTK